MNKALIPFGKLQGQPLEELANHKSYANWLITREDIKDKYPTVYTFIINHFRHLDDSPAHNRLQIKFSNRNRDHALKLAYFLEPDLFFWNSEKINNELKKRLNKASKHNDVIKTQRTEEYKSSQHLTDKKRKRI